MRPCLPPVWWLWSPYALQHPQLSRHKAPVSLHVFCISIWFGAVTMSPAFLCLLCGLRKEPVCISCCAAGWPARPATGVLCSHWAGRTLQSACSVTNTLLSFHHVVSLRCTYSAELLYSVRNPAHHLPDFSFPHYSCFFGDGGGFLVLIAKLWQKAVTCGSSSLEAKGVWGFSIWLVYWIIPANASPPVFQILQATVHYHGFGNTWIKTMGVSK